MLFPWLLLLYCGMNMGMGLQVMEHSTETWQNPVSGENVGCGKGSKWLWGAGMRLHSSAGRGSWHLGDFHLPKVGGPWPRAHIPLSDLAVGCHFPELALNSCLVLLRPLNYICCKECVFVKGDLRRKRKSKAQATTTQQNRQQ